MTEMLGLLRGKVELYAHDEMWCMHAEEIIGELKSVLGDRAIDIQHVGSTSVPGLMAKPIIDIVVGMRDLRDLDPYVEELAQKNIREAMQDLPGQRLFVTGDFDANTRTHHIHAVVWNSIAWKNYIRFRDYLRTFEEKRMTYEAEKRRLASLYAEDRNAYTEGKAPLIAQMLEEANEWAEGKNMAKAIMLCGKIASGKSVYAKRICKEDNAVMLSVDERVLSILGGDLGEKHDMITDRIQAYLFEKSVEIINAGTNVLLDWGFWTRERRSAARDFYQIRGIKCEFHYIDVPDVVWHRNIEIRNRAVLAGEDSAYYVDEGLMKKLESLFETPGKEEIDVWFVNDWHEKSQV